MTAPPRESGSGYLKKKNPGDGRSKIVVLTEKGRKFLEQEGFQRGVHLLAPLVDSNTAKPVGRLLRQSGKTRTYSTHSRPRAGQGDEKDEKRPADPPPDMVELVVP